MQKWFGPLSFIDRRRWAGQADKLPTHRLLSLPIHTPSRLRSAIDFLPWLRTYSLQALQNMIDGEIERSTERGRDDREENRQL